MKTILHGANAVLALSLDEDAGVLVLSDHEGLVILLVLEQVK